MPRSFANRDQRQVVTFDGASPSSEAGPFEGAVLSGLFFPAGWTPTTVGFQTSYNGTDWFDVYDAADGKYTLASANNPASSYVALDQNLLYGIKYLRLTQAGTNTADVRLSLS